MSDLNGAAWLDEPVRIADGHVWFGSHKLPGLIVADGITLRPAVPGEFNRLVIEFAVGAVTVEDPLIADLAAEQQP